MARGNSQKAGAPQNGSGSAAVVKQVPLETDKSLESWIWDAACSIRGAKDAAKYKEFILPLIFAKRLCDVFDHDDVQACKRWLPRLDEKWQNLLVHMSATQTDAAIDSTE
jgi:hypothetical protein